MRRLLVSLCAAACAICASLVSGTREWCGNSLVRELRRQCHPGGFGCQHRWFEREDGYLPAHRGRLAGLARRHPHPRRFGGHGAAGQERQPGHPDGHLHPGLRVRHRAESRRRTAVHPGRTQPLVGRRHDRARPSTACRCARRRSARSTPPTARTCKSRSTSTPS